MGRIVLEHVGKEFPGGVQAVRDVSLEIGDGEFMVLVGPSGCGKTTILRMIAGLDEVTDGEITIGDRVVTDEKPKDRDVAMVFQNYALYPHMTVEQNIGFGMRLRRTPSRSSSSASAGPPRCWPCSTTSPASLPTCPAGSASGSPSAGRWCVSRRPS
jgi:ABC-type sugar transport system ATPase subunit